jgi:hypothetical protein
MHEGMMGREGGWRMEDGRGKEKNSNIEPFALNTEQMNERPAPHYTNCND